MRCTATTGVAAVSDQVTLVHHITGLDQHFLKVGIPGFKTKIVDDHNTVAAEFREVRTSDESICRSKHFFAGFSPDIHPLVE